MGVPPVPAWTQRGPTVRVGRPIGGGLADAIYMSLTGCNERQPAYRCGNTPAPFAQFGAPAVGRPYSMRGPVTETWIFR